jgi:phosphoribosylglycinamide formyltransferase-1
MGAKRTAVLISGGGSNLQALLDAPGAAAEIALVVSNRPDAYGLERAQRQGVPAQLVDHRSFASREAFEAKLDRLLRDAGIELVCLAGFMRVLTPGFVEAWHDRLLNIHPSLLPAFPGLHTHARALAAGCLVHGCTVHLVRPTLDDGPILVQGVVPVLPDDDAPALAARVLEVEHRCYPLALDLVARGGMTIDGNRVTVPGGLPRLVRHDGLDAAAPPATTEERGQSARP